MFVAIIALDLAFSKEKAQRMLQQDKPELSDSIWHLRTTTARITSQRSISTSSQLWDKYNTKCDAGEGVLLLLKSYFSVVEKVL